jgi:cytochrome c-type biogenesis protein CcmH
MADRSPLAGRLIRMRALLALGLALLWLVSAAAVGEAVEPDEVLADPALETRAREIGRDLRCLVCQNQSIDDSDAELARDLRVLVRQRLTTGESNQQVIGYVVSRYGDFVLLRPPLKPATYALWFAPLAFVVIAVMAVVLFYRRRNRSGAGAAVPLSPAEERRLAALLDSGREPGEQRR